MPHNANDLVCQWLLVSEAARALRVSDWTVRRWVREGRLRSIRPGHRRLVSRADVARMLAVPARADELAANLNPTKEFGSGRT